MGTDIKLKDLFGQTQTEQDISTVSVPKADGTGREFYVKRPVIYYKLVASPPYAPEGKEDTIIFWNIGDGALLGDVPIDTGNCGGVVHAPIAGKTTKPIVVIQVEKYLEGVTADNTDKAELIYLYETLAGATLLEALEEAGTADFTAQPGWGQLIQGADGRTYTYTQLTDLSGIAIGIEQPNTIIDQRLFYSYLTAKSNTAVAYTAAKNGEHTIVPPAESSGISTVSLTVDVPEPEPNLQDKSVAITENGTQEFSPDTGYDGIKKFTANVNVAGGGGTSVQPDYAQNNSAAADYIKNRPGGYMIEYPSVTKTFTGTTDDPNYVDLGGAPAFLFTTDILPNSAILNATGKVTISDGTTTKVVDIGSILLGADMGEQGAVFDVSAVGESSPVAGIYLIKQRIPDMPETFTTGVYLIGLSDGTVTSYISEFTNAAASEPAVIDEKYLEVKSSNWGATWATPITDQTDGYISSRIGGFWGSKSNPWDFDGDLTGKEVIAPDGSDYKFVKISDDAVPLDYAARSYVDQKDFGSDTASGINIRRSDIKLFTDLVGHPITDGNGFIIKKTGAFAGAPTDLELDLVISVQTPYAMENDVKFTQGTWFLYKAGSGDTPAHYISSIGWSNGGTSGDHIVRMPYEFVEQNPNALTTDTQTLTDAQKLQARTNIGTVAGTDKEMILVSSTAGSTRKFKITVTDDGTLTATEVTQ